ncbi:MAG: LA_2272 family surface repeat-containing protein, partial [Spirochaetota bacterium]
EGNVFFLQLGGVFNVAEEVTGAQVAGILNTAKKVRGVQVGLINISDQMYGVPIGLINIVREGISTPAVWFDEAGRNWVSLQRGSNLFYGLLYAGGTPEAIFADTPVFIGGAGGGIRLGGNPKRRLFLDLDASVKAEIDSSRFREDVSTWNLTSVPSARATLGLRLFDRLSIIGGVYGDVRFTDDGGQKILFTSDTISASVDLVGAEVYPTFFLGLARK